MEENKINFLCPTSPSSSSSEPPTGFPSQLQLSHDLSGSQRQIALTQIYPNCKAMKTSTFRKRSSSGTMRSKPYYIPLRHRQRTQSESQENQGNSSEVNDASSMEIELAQMDTDIELNHQCNTLPFNKTKHVQLKKSKSCENLSSTTSDKELKGQKVFTSNASTMEFFVNRIQKLNLVHD